MPATPAWTQVRRCALVKGRTSCTQPELRRRLLTCRLLEAFGRFTSPATPPALRRAAHAARSSLLYASRGADATIRAALAAAADEHSPTVRCDSVTTRSPVCLLPG